MITMMVRLMKEDLGWFFERKSCGESLAEAMLGGVCLMLLWIACMYAPLLVQP